MVSYQKFVSIYFDVVDANGQEQAARGMSEAAELWRENKADLQTATVSEVREALQRRT